MQLLILSSYLFYIFINMMMRGGRKLKKWRLRARTILTNYFALPSDVVLELPRITLIGQLHLYIENHKGLIVYSKTELKLKTNNGFVQIKGTDFTIKKMLHDEILLEGTIEEVKFARK